MSRHSISLNENNLDDEQSLAPIKESARIDVMDILRGFALIGIVFMNIEWFNRSGTNLRSFDTSLTGLDQTVGWLVRAFVEGKFYKLFALLFGMGFAVMLIRAREVGRPFGAWFMRRMLFLMFIGYAHAILLWDGDIVHDYAFAGLVFLGLIYLFETRWLKRFNTPETFLKIGLVWLLLPIMMAIIAGIGFGTQSSHDEITRQWQRNIAIAAAVKQRLAEPAPENETQSEERDALAPMENAINNRVAAEQARARRAEKEVEIMSGDSYLDAVRYRASRLKRDAGSMVRFTFVLFIPIFLVGYWFIASGTLKHHREHRQLFKSLAIIGLVFGTILSVSALLIMQQPIRAMPISISAVAFFIFNLGQLAMATGYLGLIVILAGQAACQRALKWLAPFGRMALTNYIMQSLILSSLFFGYAGGLYGEISRAPQMLIVVAIVTFQIVLSAWWLKRFRFGPLEWLWRSATYLSWQPMRN